MPFQYDMRRFPTFQSPTAYGGLTLYYQGATEADLAVLIQHLQMMANQTGYSIVLRSSVNGGPSYTLRPANYRQQVIRRYY